MIELPLDLPRALYDQLRRHSEAAYPHECCGILLGILSPETRKVITIVAVPNASRTPANRYQIAPGDIIRALSRARADGLEIVGFYHSHPDHPPEPSATDRIEAHWLGCSYLITSVIQGNSAETCSFRLIGSQEEDKRFEPEAIQIIQTPGRPQAVPSNPHSSG